MKRWLTLVLTAVLGLILLLASDRYYRNHIQRENFQQLATELEETRQQLEEGIDQRILVLEGLRAFILAAPSMPDSPSFNRYAANVLSHAPEVQALQYVDTDHIIRYIYPLEGNKAALNLDLMTRPAAPFVEKAIRTRMITVNDPTVTVQGSLSIVARAPIYDGDRYLGLVQGVMEISSLLNGVSASLPPRLAISLTDARGNHFWQTHTLSDNTLSSMVQAGDNRWEMTLGWVPREPGPQSYVLGLIWGLGGALLISVLFIINQTFRRVDWLSTVVADKTAGLSRSEARYRTLVETTDDVFLLTDLEGRQLFRNSAYFTSLGVEETDELSGFPRVHPDDEPRLREKMRGLLATGVARAEYRIRHKDGQWIYHSAHSKLIRDEQGNPPSILSIIRDITDRKLAEQELLATNNLLEKTFASLKEAVLVVNPPDRKIVLCNPAVEDIFGYAVDELIGKNTSILYTDQKTYDRFAHIGEPILEETGSFQTEFEMRRKDGQLIVTEHLVTTLSDESGWTGGVVSVIRDITKRKETELALHEIAENMATAQRIAHFGSWEIALSDDLEFVDPQLWSDECYRIFGLEPGEVEITKEFFYNHLHPDDREQAWQALRQAIQERTETAYEYRLVRPDGAIRHLRDQVRVVVDEATDRPVKVVGTVQDITARRQLEEERQQLEKQLFQAQKMEAVGRLTAGIAHDFNNLIMAINGTAELMQLRLRPEDALYRMADNILNSGIRAADLIRQLLIFSRKQIVTPKTVELNAIITEMNTMLERIIGEDVVVILNLAPELWPIRIDPTQIEQVVVNLAVNARDAMPAGGRLILETANVVLDKTCTTSDAKVEPGEYVVLRARDTGIGMSQEVQEHLFEPFFTTKPVGKGTGLGLATVYGIVKQNGGHIWVDSEESEGSTFKIYLPRTKEETEPELPPPLTSAMEPGYETILVVEDGSTIRELAQTVLQQQGYTVLDAENGQQALGLAAQHPGPIHLLLTDVIMPGMSGKTLAEKLSQQYPQLKTIFMSGYSDEIISRHGMLDPDIVFLQKPFGVMEMVRKVRQVLG